MNKLNEEESDVDKKIFKLLKFLLLFFYACFILLWFKDNIQPLKKFPVSYLLALVPLIGIVFIQFLYKMKYKKIRIHLRFNKVFWAVFILILIAIAFRLPFLVNNYGLMSSDHAIPALMAKHISEGKLAPVYYYGQFYMGTLSQHFFALMFVIFGYSIFLLKFTTLLFFLAFIAIQFILMKEILSFRFSLLLSLFYCLPIGQLIDVSFDNTGAFSLVLLLGSSIIYVTFLIYWKDKENLIPFLGFLTGISFWTHQIIICFILTSLTILLFKFKLNLKKYLSLFFFFLAGCLPLLILEIFKKFRLIKFLISGPADIELSFFEKLKTTIGLTRSLISPESHASNILFLVLLFSGFLSLLYFSVRKRRLLPQTIFSVFFIFFYLIYLSSSFSDIPTTRYLYPLYFCLPALLVSAFNFLKSGRQQLLSLILILLIFFPYNLKHTFSDFQGAKDSHLHLKRILESMKETGEKYWRGNYWTAYLITALSKEDIIVDSDTVNRYYPYSLLYYNETQGENFVFLRGPGSVERDRANGLINLLDSLDIDFQKEKIGDAWLVYGVRDPVFEKTFKVPVPSKVPDLVLNRISSSRGYLALNFQNNEIGEGLEFRVNVEIPGYSSASKKLMSDEKEIQVRIPFPRKSSFKIKYYVDYQRLKIGSTIEELLYNTSDGDLNERASDTVYLTGFPPPQVSIHDKKMRICEKVARLEISEFLGRKTHNIKLYLYSPFEFSHPYWYGDYCQKVRIEINGFYFAEKIIKEGYNVVEIEGNGKSLFINKGTNIITLRFEYQFPFNFAPIWRTSALLEKIAFE